MTNTGNLSTRRGSKSAAAFRTISEVADELEVPQHVLRFWETKFSQVRPMKRGGGRRYYRPDDIELLRSIRGLLYDDGYTIKGVQKLLRENGLKPTKAASAAPAPTKPAAAPTPPEGAGIGAHQRKELQAVLNELESLRKLLGS